MPNSLKIIDTIRSLWRGGQTTEALHYLVSKVPEECYTEEFLISKACLIQISDTEEYELKDAEECLKLACEFYTNSFEAHFELGKFYDTVMANPQNGLRYLLAAKEILNMQLKEVEQAIQECS